MVFHSPNDGPLRSQKTVCVVVIPGLCVLAKALARRSGEIDPTGVNSDVTAAGVQRGDPGDNDAYYTVTVRFSFFIDTDNLGGGRRYGCPVW